MRDAAPATPRLRGRAGQKQRDRRLKRSNYLCEDCAKVGRVTLAKVVDHIVPLAHGGPDTDENTRNLCEEHNLKRTAEQFAFKSGGPKLQRTDGW